MAIGDYNPEKEERQAEARKIEAENIVRKLKTGAYKAPGVKWDHVRKVGRVLGSLFFLRRKQRVPDHQIITEFKKYDPRP